MISVGVATATAAIIVGVVTTTGLVSRFIKLIDTLAFGQYDPDAYIDGHDQPYSGHGHAHYGQHNLRAFIEKDDNIVEIVKISQRQPSLTSKS